MGLPRLAGRVGQFAEWQPTHITPDVAQGKRDDDDVPHQVKVGNSLMQDKDETEETATDIRQQGPRNLGVGWTLVYYALLVVGAYGFFELLWPLTESSNALAAF